MAVPTTLRDLRGPYTIQFKTNLDSGFGDDMSAYIEAFTLDERLEDEPYTFIENELRLSFFDHDGGFIQDTWDTDITAVQVRLRSHGTTQFQGTLTVPSDATVTKYAALGYEERTQQGSLIFTTNIEQWDYSVEIIEVTVIDDSPQPGSGQDFIIKKQLEREGLPQTLGSNTYRPNWFRLDKILDYLFEGRLDYSELEDTINNTNGYCIYFIDRRYFEDNNRTTLGFLQAVAELFDALVTYDPVKDVLYLFLREQSDASTTLSEPVYEKHWESRAPEYSGIELHYSPPPPSWSRLDALESATFLKFDADGNKVTGRTTDLPREGEVTVLIGETGGSVLDFDLELLRHVTTYDFDPVDDIPDAEQPDDFDHLVPSSILLRINRFIALANAALKYGKADVVVRNTENAENIPVVGGLYAIDANTGYVTQMTFDSEDRIVDYTWKQNLAYTGEISRADFDGARPQGRSR